MTANDADARFRADPRTWHVFRKTRFAIRLCFGLMLFATALFLPSAWIILAPHDPLLRPDLHEQWAWLTLVLCVLVLYTASRITRSVKAAYAAKIHNLVDATRSDADAMAVTLDVEISPAYPNLLISRRHQLLGVASPTPLFVKFADIADVKTTQQKKRSIWDKLSPNNTVIEISMKDPAQAPIISMGGNGLSRVTADETHFVANKLHEYVFPPPSWRPEIGEGLRPETLDYIKNLRLT